MAPRARFLSVLVLLLTVCAGRAEDVRSLRTEALEKYEDSPMYIFRQGVSAAMVSGHAGYTSYQVNVDVSGLNITGDAANEPSLCVDPNNHNRMAIGWRQFDSAGSNFRQAGWGYTSSGGTAWKFPGVLQSNVFRSDPVLMSDDSGKFFYLSLLHTFYDDMWRSLNGGFSWARIGFATGGDKQWFTIDKTNSSSRGFQYQCWSTAGNNYQGRQFNRSTDGGATWGNPVNIPNSPIWGTLDVDTNGNVFIGGVNAKTRQVWCTRSSNARLAGVTPTFDRATPVSLGGDIESDQLINPVGLLGQISLVVDRSGGNTNNNIYMLASVRRFGASSGSDVMIVRSTDGGLSFSAPRRVNDDPINQNKWHWLASLSVAPNGRLDAVWLDTRNAANNTDSQLFYSYSKDGGTTWSTNVAVSEPFNPFVGYPAQRKMGDYISSVSDDGGVDVAYTATFNGEEDVYYVRVSAAASKLLNVSSRAHVLTDERVAIAGFIVGGTQPKSVIIRGLGPSLNGIASALADPTLELHRGGVTIARNDDWKRRADGSSQQARVEVTGIPPRNDTESAIVATLNPGQYTAVFAGKNGTTGTGVVEVYDLAPAATSRLANISTRAFVGTGDEVLIGGFIIGGGRGSAGRVLVRAVGPSLGNQGVQGALGDPKLELHDANGVTTATNDNWKVNDQTGQSQEAEVRSTTLAPSDERECAIVAILPSGPHTAVVRGKNNTTGVALVEVYGLP